MSTPYLDVSQYATQTGANRWPLLARAPRLRPDDMSPERCRLETVVSPIEFKGEIPESAKELNKSQEHSIAMCCELFEVKCHRDFECHCRHVEVKDIDGVISFMKDNPSLDVLMVPDTTLDMLINAKLATKFDGGKTAFGEDILVFDLAETSAIVVPSPVLAGVGVAIKSSDIVIRLITQETLIGKSAMISGWVDMGDPSNHFVFELPWEDGDLYE